MLALPPYTTYPSGHATECRLVAYVLTQLLRDATPSKPRPSQERIDWIDKTEDLLESLAVRIADNRVVAGIHFPLDGEAGFRLAKFLFDGLVEVRSKPGSSHGNVYAWLWQQAVAEWK